MRETESVPSLPSPGHICRHHTYILHYCALFNIVTIQVHLRCASLNAGDNRLLRHIWKVPVNEGGTTYIQRSFNGK